MGRGKYYSWWRRAGERLEATIYQENWASRLGWHLGLQGRLNIDRRDFYLPLPARTQCKIAFISDLHAGPLTDCRLFDLALSAISEFSPDILLLGGDYVSLHERHIHQLTRRLQQFCPHIPKFAVMGNHDLWLDDNFIANELSKVGVQVLVNENFSLPVPFDGISVCGLDEPGVGQPDPERTFAGAQKLRLLLMHSPEGMKYVQDQRFDIAFCGHTHGGQIAFPWGKPVFLPPGSGERRYANGLFALSDQRFLLTSRGIGMSDLPVRLFASSEVHLCTLLGQDEA